MVTDEGAGGKGVDARPIAQGRYDSVPRCQNSLGRCLTPHRQGGILTISLSSVDQEDPMHRSRLAVGSLAMVVAVAATMLLRSVSVSTSQDPLRVTVKTGEWFYEPKGITVTSSTAVSLTLEHVGSTSIPHDIVFELADGQKVASIQIRGGQTDALGFIAPVQAGEYVFYCSVGNHRSRGMEGKLTVASSGSAEPSPMMTDEGTPTPAATSTGVPPSGKTPTITTTPRPAYLPRTFWLPADFKTSTPRPFPTREPFPGPRCPDPRVICLPCPGCTKTPEPGAGTPTECPFCRPR